MPQATKRRRFLASIASFITRISASPGDSDLRLANNLAPGVALSLAVINLAGTTIVTFVLLNFFVGQENLFKKRPRVCCSTSYPRK